MGDGDRGFRVFINTIRVLAIVRRKNMTHGEIARDLSTTADYWSHVINGRKGVSPRMGKRITSHPAFRGRRWDDIFRLEEYDV